MPALWHQRVREKGIIMTSYSEERKQKDAAKAQRAKRYVYTPVLFDVCNPTKGRTLSPNEVVVKIQPHGCPRNGTMGMCYVGDPFTGEFIGMVCEASLTPKHEWDHGRVTA